MGLQRAGVHCCFAIIFLHIARKTLACANRKILLQTDSEARAEQSQMWLLLPQLTLPPLSHELLQEFILTAARFARNVKQLPNACWCGEVTPAQRCSALPLRATNRSSSRAASHVAHTSLPQGWQPQERNRAEQQKVETAFAIQL